MPNLIDNEAKIAAAWIGKRVTCLLYTSDAADERSSVDLGGRRIIKKKNNVSKRMNTRDNNDETRRREPQVDSRHN